MANARPTFTFVPRRRVIGLSFGMMRSLHRGSGTDIAGSRPYRRGDSMDVIDWAASARLSTARDADEFLVRERFAEEAPKIILVCDRRPNMAHFAPPLPWLDKPAAMRQVVELVLASAGASGGYVGYLDFADGEAHWRQPKGERKLLEIRDERLISSEFGGPADWLERSVAHLAEQRRGASAGTFVFVLSDFIPSPAEDLWLTASEHRWDIVPVVIQDPVWEASFPEIGGVVVTFVDAASGAVRRVRMRRGEARRLRAAHEARHDALVRGFIDLGLEPVVLTSSDPDTILAAFLSWADARLLDRRAGR